MELIDNLHAGNQAQESGARYLTFHTDGQLFGLPITEIVQITKIQEIIGLPEQPYYVKGIINLRGQIIPVIDVRLRFGKQAVPPDERTCIIITHVRGSDFGLIVDEVDEVTDILPEQISAPPMISVGGDNVNAYITGVAKLKASHGHKDRVALLIQAAKILGEAEFAFLSQAAGDLA
ncbi:MAG: chemotaxis protein CheW [Candidatus Pelethousia sp.]|nr:chemotaxis protein CheW [Candidatus Pelethousia sp.]